MPEEPELAGAPPDVFVDVIAPAAPPELDVERGGGPLPRSEELHATAARRTAQKHAREMDVGIANLLEKKTGTANRAGLNGNTLRLPCDHRFDRLDELELDAGWGSFCFDESFPRLTALAATLPGGRDALAMTNTRFVEYPG
jgi:hypothetical protein